LVFVASLIIGAAVSLSSVANAAWPSGGTRTIPGQTCVVHPFGIDTHGFDCPFVSDYSGTVDTYWGNYNSGIYADFHVTASDNLSVDGCRQSWTGSAAVCASDGTTFASAAGPVDLGAPGFSTITVGTATQWDYFYTYVASVGSSTIDHIYGVGYY
jgi:hypothetical protein